VGTRHFRKQYLIVFTGVIFLLGTAGARGFLQWLQTPSGASAVSRWLTVRLEKEFPGTRIMVRELRISPGQTLHVEVQEVRWERKNEEILILESTVVDTPLLSWLRKPLRWEGQAKVKMLNLVSADQAFAHGKWQMRGVASGWLRMRVSGARTEELTLSLEAHPPGGSLSREALERILSLVPKEDLREVLLAAIKMKDSFDYRVGRLGVVTEKENYAFYVYLDGDHLLDVTVRVPKEGIGLLADLLP